MGYLSCRAESSISTCRSIAAVAPSQNQSKKIKKPPSSSNSSTQYDDQDNQNDDDDGRRIEHFTYAELESATGNFSSSSLLGRGSHGAVYRATLHRHRPSVVAVKRPSSRAVLPAVNEVENEIDILSKIRSPRLVNLIGFTQHQQQRQRLLVVEFMPNGTLYDYLHTNPRPPGWPRRLRLALQTAKGLLTLHSARPPVIHRDVKSANILIDRNFNARLADFGLALRLEDPATALPSSCRSTPPAGTLGYLDPCYVTPENLSIKTDVFSFGILLLEIMSGRKAIDVAHSPPSVVEWAVPLLRKGKVGAIYDPRVAPLKDSRVRRQLALLAASCVRSSDERRPTMEEVVEQLKVLVKAVNAAAKAWNGPCSVVETEGTLSKVKAKEKTKDNSNGESFSKGSSGVMDTPKLLEVPSRREAAVWAAIKKPPLPVYANSSVKASQPLRNEKMFFDGEAKRGGRNLQELMARPDGEIIQFCGDRSSAISRARTLRVASDRNANGGMVRLQRNLTVSGTQFESNVTLEASHNSDGKLQGRARHVA